MIDDKTTTDSKAIHFGTTEGDLNAQSFGYKSMAFVDKLLAVVNELDRHKGSTAYDLLSYTWTFEAKDFTIYLRDALLGLLKMENYHEDGIKSEQELEAYKDQIRSTLSEANVSLVDNYDKSLAGEGNVDPAWIHESNPVSLIKSQLTDIQNQIKTICRGQNKLDQVRKTFSDFNSTYSNYIQERISRCESLEQRLQEMKEHIDNCADVITQAEASKLVIKLQANINELETLKSLSQYQFIVLEDTNKLKLAVDTDGGKLISKSIDILSEISGWISFNLSSPLKAIDTRLKVYTEKIQICLFQLLNRIKARLEGHEEEVAIPKSNILTPIQKLISEHHNDVEKTCNVELDKLRTTLQTQISPSQLFSKKHNFLPSATLGQLSTFTEKTALERRYNWPRIKNFITDSSSRLFSKYEAKEQITAAGYIANILSFDPEADSNALFLKNGFLGSSFSVDRPELMTKVDQHFKLWQAKYGGALLVEGGHFSGRSSLLEMIPLVYPDFISHHIVPGQKMDINGHKKVITHDLMETLAFIAKYKGSDKCIVTIDDLDYYSTSPEKTFDLYDSLRALIARYSKQIYFVISMHSLLREKLQNYFDFDEVFTETISTNYMPTDLIQQAVLTRAHAVAKNEDVINHSDALNSMARKVAKKANNNVGKAMQLWCMYQNGDYKGDGSNMQFRKLVRKHHTILRLLVMHGALYEPNLRSILNEIDGQQLKSEVKSLIQQRLLIRPDEGYISINPYLLIFVETILNKS